MPKIELNRSIEINESPDKVFKALNDFNHWPAWSPWLILEPETVVKVAPDAKYYEWEGKRIGSGNMRITSEVKNKSLYLDLTFLKPWKSKAKVRFELAPISGGTQLTWFMDSSLPFFMFWMKKMMLGFIGMDYERGLNLLKDYVEDGEVHSKLDFRGEQALSKVQYIGIHSHSTIDTIDQDMKRDFGKLWEYFKDKEDMIAGKMFSIYQKWDFANGKVEYTSGIPVSAVLHDLPSEFKVSEIPATKVYTLRHIGPYKHLGNAWSAMHNMHRAKAIKTEKRIPPFEEYVSMPGKVPDNELVTDVHFPVK
ncbi:SRPBCC family protein [Roseivirga echinicomitans]|uniref:AraC effector-binding domain-containing protein n=1 Tax=Roseivirga echinicomitans TaxID=296218 RepID=A0A150X9N9_9BACT|nr:SRPBCC family protein [Roseivirga echinicomitans]KYG75441.1 hypothetical protein AWN68_07805 [Roseivirga echinicomitans]